MAGGLPPGYGKANNPTGKGLVHDGSQGHGPAIAAGKAITKMLVAAMMEGDQPRAKAMCEALADKAARGDEWAVEFVFNRIIGKQDTLGEALRESGAAISRIEFVVIDPIDAGTNSPEITTSYTSQ